MKTLYIAITMLALATIAHGQQIMEGATYYLPKSTVNIILQIEKTTVSPGMLNEYAERFLKRTDVPSQSFENWRLLNVQIIPSAVPDTTKRFTARIDNKHNIQRLALAPDGIILAVNADASLLAPRVPFRPAPPQTLPSPHDYMNQDILAAGSRAKMAELVAQEIYDIRESRSMLAKGQADFMPKDGEQLRLMMQSLDIQEAALMQVFTGTTTRDTTEVILNYVPEKEESHVLFRFSSRFGLSDADDLSGEPYYLSVTDLHQITENAAVAEGKLPKDNAEIYVNLPGRIRIELSHDNLTLTSCEMMATQFGRTESLDNELFGKKLFTQLVYHPLTGSIQHINSEMVKK